MMRLRPACILAAGLVWMQTAAKAQLLGTNPDTARSVSGQFVVAFLPDHSPYYRHPLAVTNSALLRLDVPWLAVSAERFKLALWRELGVEPDASWSGRVFVNLHQAQKLDESVVIVSQPFLRVWNYRVDMPNIISPNRYARTLSAVILLELANRRVPVNRAPAELPAWLVDGMARQVMEADQAKVILSGPTKTVDRVINIKQRGIDPLASAREVLQNSPALTFDQLSWPNNDQMTGNDGGVYLASVQLFLDELLDLKDGPAEMRQFLAELPACQNWQSAFYRAFGDHFQRPLAVEKWWALRVVAFAAHSPGPQWTPIVGCQKLNALLRVPVEVRASSNAMPTRAELSLQQAVRVFESSRRDDILRAKLRDIQLAELRLVSSLAVVAAGYEDALAGFLGEKRNHSVLLSPHKSVAARRTPADITSLIKKLDALDIHRQKIVARVESESIRLGR